MPRYHRLKIDVEAEPWTLDATEALGQALGIWGGSGSATTMMDATGVRIAPEDIQQPVAIDLSGKTPASLVTYFRMDWRDQRSTTDVLASPALMEILASARLPRHVPLTCTARVSAPILSRQRTKALSPQPYSWLFWQEYFDDRLDPSRSRFALLYRDGSWAEASYDCLEDLRQVQRRAGSIQGDLHALCEIELAWADPSVDDLDLVPLGTDLYLSPWLAERLKASALPGIAVLPPRGYSGPTWC